MPEDAVISSTEDMISKRRKELFGDCALIEIIHLHGAYTRLLRSDVHVVVAKRQS